MIRAAVFDCFGVLTTDTWRAFVDDLPEGVDADAARSLNQAFGAGFISREEFFAEIRALTGQLPPLTEDIGEMTKNTALLEYVRELRGRGLKIGLLSNIASNWIRDTFLTAEEQALFDEMVLSFEVGMVKPDPRIFRLVCEKLRVAPAEAIMVDDIDRYCAVAEAEGMKVVVYDSLKQTKQEIEKLLEN